MGFLKGFDRAFQLFYRISSIGEMKNKFLTKTLGKGNFLYNLAICAEVRGDFGNAMDLLTKADGALNKPNDLITTGTERVSDAIKNNKS